MYMVPVALSSASSLPVAILRSRVPSEFTTICTSSVALSWLSFAVRLSTYVPGVVKLACVSTAFAPWNVTGPGPLTTPHVVVTAPGGFGRPSSLTVPSSTALAGSVIV